MTSKDYVIDFDSAYRVVEQDYPSLLKKAYPRRYDTGSWPSPKFLSVLALNSILECAGDFNVMGHKNKIGVSVYYTIARLIKNEVPTYFVKPDLLKALIHTELPSSLRLSDLKWPREAMMFVLPPNIITSPDGQPIYLAIAKHKGCEAVNIDNELECEKTLATSRDFVSTFCMVKEGVSYGWSHPLNDDMVDVLENDPIFPFVTFDEVGDDVKIIETSMDQDSQKFTHFHIRLALQLLMVMIARPEIVTDGKFLRRIKNKHATDSKSDLWSPTTLGDHYKICRENTPSEGCHTSPRSHWRSGHLRHYVPGEGKPWKKNDVKWIEPVWIG